MDTPVVLFLVIVAILTGIPSWVTGAMLKRRSKEEGGGGTDWFPLGYLGYGLRDFQHPKKFAIVWAYAFSTILSWGSILALVVLLLRRRLG
jgi:hypothetical protein